MNKYLIIIVVPNFLYGGHNHHVTETQHQTSAIAAHTEHEERKVDQEQQSLKIMPHEMGAPPNHSMSEHAQTDHAMSKHMMHGMYGHYPMTRESSGTSWVPESMPFPGFYTMHKEWMMMYEGFSYTVYDHQGGCRGGKKFFDENMFMFMAQKDNRCGDTFAIRTMFALEPFTIGKCGYPLLFQTGETCDGKTPLIDRQHPHDLFGELALVFTRILREESSFFLYVGLPGEPALGPPTFLHRYSGLYIPESPLGHHWMDSTHITFGVATAGFIWDKVKIETSVFTGREPDQHRYNFDRPRFDSYSVRISCNPSADLAFQASYGFLRGPEQLEPTIDVRRYTMSGIYNKSFTRGNWQTTAVIGVNDNDPGNILSAFLLESTVGIDKHVLFARFEDVEKDELFIAPSPLAGQPFTVKKITGGYVYHVVEHNHISLGFGGLLSKSWVQEPAVRCYGNTFSYMVFMQVRLI